MKTDHRNRRRLSALLMIPVLVVLSGCMKLHMDVDIRAENDAVLSMEIVDEMGFLELEEEGCSEFSDDVGDSTVEQFTDADGNFGCRISGNVGEAAASDGFLISQDGNELVFKLTDMDMGLGEDENIDLDDPMMDMFAPDIRISATFPGKVTYASEGGKIEGNTVTWTGLEIFTGTIEARGEAKGGIFGGGSGSEADKGDAAAPDATQSPAAPEDEDPANEDAVVAPAPDAADSESSGLPMWVVIVLGLLLLLVIALIIMVARKGRAGKAAVAGAQYPPQPHQAQYPQHGQYPQQQQWDHTQQYPQQGQPGEWNGGNQPPSQ